MSEKNQSFYMMCPSIGLDSGNYTLSESGYDVTTKYKIMTRLGGQALKGHRKLCLDTKRGLLVKC